jgi:hypothetical protein
MWTSVRSAGRVLLAAASGYAAAVIVLTVLTPAAEMAGWRLDGPPTTSALAINLAISFVGAVAAGYISARLAPTGRIVIAMGVLVVVFLAVAVGLSRLLPDAPQPPSYRPLVTLLSVIGVWTGGMIERALHGRASRTSEPI